MAKLKVLLYPNPSLRTIAKSVAEVDDTVRALVNDMLETMYAEKGVGLAATQVGIHLRILVMDTSPTYNNPRILINPEIIHQENVKVMSEACLSFPGITIEVQRAEKIRVRTLTLENETIEFDAQGLECQCIQHEFDHLDGVVFTDHLSKLKRERANKKVLKIIRAYGLDDAAKEAS